MSSSESDIKKRTSLLMNLRMKPMITWLLIWNWNEGEGIYVYSYNRKWLGLSDTSSSSDGTMECI